MDNEALIEAAPTVMSEMIDRALDKLRAWQDAESPKFSNELWKAKLQEFMNEAFTEFDHDFESREQLSAAHTAGLERSEAKVRARIAAARDA